MRVGKNTIYRAVRKMANSALINSGALVQLNPLDLDIEVVAVSASSHVSPVYKYSAEAPRIYGDSSARDMEDAWLIWISDVLGAHIPGRLECRTRREWLKRCAEAILSARERCISHKHI